MGRVWKTTLPDNTSVTNEYYPTGLLKRKSGSRQYPVEYGYDSQGRLKASYGYNPAGDLASVDYADATPDIAYGHDRLGRQTTISQGAAVTHRQYGEGGQLLSESWQGGPLDGLSVENTYDQYLRRTNVAVLGPQSAV